MNRRTTKIIAMTIAIVMILFVVAGSAMVFAEEENNEDYLKDDVELLRKLIIYIEKNYVTEVDSSDLIKGAYKGIYDELDKYSNFFPENEDYENFVEAVSGEYSGIGIVVTEKEGKTVVVAPMPDSPAYEQGMKTDDIIVEIDGIDVREYSSEMIVSLLRGEPGTPVVVGVERTGIVEVMLFNITRQTIKIESVSAEVLEGNTGYIRILSFDSDTGKEFAAKLAEIREQDIDSLIVDLRNNGGGYIDTAVDVAEQLIPEGPVTHLETRGNIINTYYSETPQIDIPVAVLINEGTASASEILAGAVQDTNTGVLVGTTSFGKGSAQQSLNLQGVGGMKLTIAHFLSPDENIIHEVGLTPDIVIAKNDGEAKTLIQEANGFAPMLEDDKPALNDVGLNVYGAQQRLRFLGYQQVEVTGVYDATTFEVIKFFQNANGLYPYGVLDHTTRDTLNQQMVYYIENIDKDLQLERAIEYLENQ